MTGTAAQSRTERHHDDPPCHPVARAPQPWPRARDDPRGVRLRGGAGCRRDRSRRVNAGRRGRSRRVPADISEIGTLRVGTDASYAPNEFFDVDGETIIGMDIDLFDAVASELGLHAENHSAEFASIILNVYSDKYNVGVSSFTVSEERMLEVNMVTYFNAGTQWAVAEGNPLTCSSTKAGIRPPAPWCPVRLTPCWLTSPWPPTPFSRSAGTSRPQASCTTPRHTASDRDGSTPSGFGILGGG